MLLKLIGLVISANVLGPVLFTLPQSRCFPPVVHGEKHKSDRCGGTGKALWTCTALAGLFCCLHSCARMVEVN